MIKVLVIRDLGDKIMKHLGSEAGLSETPQVDLNMDLSFDTFSSCIDGPFAVAKNGWFF